MKLLAALLLVLSTTATAATPWWPKNRQVDIYMDFVNSPLSLVDLYYSTQYAAWAWGQRTGLNLNVRGSLALTNDRTRGIGIRFTDAETLRIMRAEGSVAATWMIYNSRTLELEFAYIMIDTQYITDYGICYANILVHEMGHAIGILDHSDDPSDVMHAHYDPSDCRHMVTANDVRLSSYEPIICHAELSPVGDLYIPSIRGSAVTLRNIGGTQWRVDQIRPADGSCSGSIFGDRVRIPELKTFDAWMAGHPKQRKNYSVTLKIVGDLIEFVDGTER